MGESLHRFIATFRAAHRPPGPPLRWRLRRWCRRRRCSARRSSSGARAWRRSETSWRSAADGSCRGCVFSICFMFSCYAACIFPWFLSIFWGRPLDAFRCASFFSKCFGSFLWSFMISLEWFGGFQGLLQVLAGFDSTCWYAAQGVIKQRSLLGLTYHQENTVNLWILRFRCFNPSDVFGSGPPVEENYPSSLWHVPTTLLATVHRPRKTGRYSAWAKWGHISYLCRSINDTLCPNTSNSWEKRQIRINQFGSKPCISKSLANGIPSNRCWPPKNGTPFHAT